jgi:hypothetical protein
VTISPGKISAPDCVASGAALTALMAGEEGAVSISTSDAYGNAVTPSPSQRAGFIASIVDVIDINEKTEGTVTSEGNGLAVRYTLERAGE